eukprot:TRINITY_DN11831_c0_g1_i1.p1 TRINITY_DN11831_c0_g1~~TRINITY_DN11831_c0_g1_i1.p1  ORF type:complete len:720 (-),score=103.50 TRINITY_DN11831_c0_g1_i1:293-2452(-)
MSALARGRHLPLSFQLLLICASRSWAQGPSGLRAPCYPLDVMSPYQSTWSCSDRLHDSWPQHWTGDTVTMFGLVSVDGKVYRFMGPETHGVIVPVAQQLGVVVTPTTTTYTFNVSGVVLAVEWLSPSFGQDKNLSLASLPVTHVTFSVTSDKDTPFREVEVYFDLGADSVTSSPKQKVIWNRTKDNSTGLVTMRVGTTAQKVAGQKGDLIDWGYRYVALRESSNATNTTHTSMRAGLDTRRAFVARKYWNLTDDMSGPRPAGKEPVVLSTACKLSWPALQQVKSSCSLMLVLDEVVAMKYFGTDMPPLWHHTYNASAVKLLNAAADMYATTRAAAESFDEELKEKIVAVGGDKYAELCALVYRQVTGATVVAWNPVLSKPWPFMKEISSDGDVSTVDVIYPAFPFYMYLMPEYFRLLMEPLMVYSSNGTKAYGLDVPYNLSWAPHHLGTWPVCDLAPQAQEQMPVEESGNMLIMIYGVAVQQSRVASASQTGWLQPYWKLLQSWADFLIHNLPDTTNQLCTDDFEGPNPHNANLGAKGIVAVAAYAALLQQDGQYAKAERYQKHADDLVQRWVELATEVSHYRRQLNANGTWSQKYNLVWQKALNLDTLFPATVFMAENAYYRTKANAYGIPLDERHNYTKADWSIWSAAMGSAADFKFTVDSLWKFANETVDRVPFTDWFDTKTGKQQGFRARPVMGGLYIRMLVGASGSEADFEMYV